MKRMLINATHPEEVRVALVDGQRLYDLDIEHRTREQKKANIYKGKITRVEPSLEAAFVDFGAERHGFLPLKEISRQYFQKDPKDIQGRVNIKEVIKEGQEVIVQVAKEERGNKGAALTTFISLAGRYPVLMPNNPRAGGISRRIEGEERAQLKEALGALTIPDEMGVIVRTAGLGRSAEELQWDLNYLLKLWTSIDDASQDRKAPFLIYQESNVIIRAIRDYLRKDIGEVLIVSKKVYDEAQGFVQQVMQDFQHKIKLYDDETPLFSRFQIESQIETAFEREVKLPSGGSIVIDPTEALVSIDINSSRATKGADIEETALNTNLEAAEEIARQLRLRDIGGLIVVDFIDMGPARNQRDVENRMRDALEQDRARIQLGRISRFGLLELSRQRLRPSLGETSSIVCPRCDGQGHIRDVKSLALSILRLIEEEVMKERTGEIQAQVPVALATYLLNEKRDPLRAIEKNHNVRVVIIPNQNLDTPHFEVERIRDDQTSAQLSHEMDLLEGNKDADIASAQDTEIKTQEPAVKLMAPDTAPPPPKPAAAAPTAQAQNLGLLARLFTWLAQVFTAEPKPAKVKKEQPQRKGDNKQRQQQNARGRGGNNRNRNDNRNDGRNNDNRGKNDNRNKRDGGKAGDNDNRNNRNKRQNDKDGGRKNDNRQADNRASDNRNDNRSDNKDDGNRNERRGRNDNRRNNRNNDNRGDGRNDNKANDSGKPRNNRKPDNAADSADSKGNDKGPKAPRRTDAKDDRPLRERQRPGKGENNSDGKNAVTQASADKPQRNKTPKPARPRNEQPAPVDDEGHPPAKLVPAQEPSAQAKTDDQAKKEVAKAAQTNEQPPTASKPQAAAEPKQEPTAAPAQPQQPAAEQQPAAQAPAEQNTAAPKAEDDKPASAQQTTSDTAAATPAQEKPVAESQPQQPKADAPKTADAENVAQPAPQAEAAKDAPAAQPEAAKPAEAPAPTKPVEEKQAEKALEAEAPKAEAPAAEPAAQNRASNDPRSPGYKPTPAAPAPKAEEKPKPAPASNELPSRATEVKAVKAEVKPAAAEQGRASNDPRQRRREQLAAQEAAAKAQQAESSSED